MLGGGIKGQRFGFSGGGWRLRVQHEPRVGSAGVDDVCMYNMKHGLVSAGVGEVTDRPNKHQHIIALEATGGHEHDD